MANNEPKLDDRMKSLSPEKRKLIARLLEQRQSNKSSNPEAVNADQAGKKLRNEEAISASGYRKVEVLAERLDYEDPGTKNSASDMYDAYHENCNSTVFGEYSWFMNLGYVPNDNKQYSQVSLPDHMPNRNSVNLAVEVIGDSDLSDCEILDVGCGRGGTIHQMQTHFKPASIVGIDLSPGGIAYCERTHRYANTRFVNGDAEDLPFEDASFDRVINIESSHNYPTRYNFYKEVCRVLRSGGHFLYSDVLPVDMFLESMEFLKQLGFEVERDQNISSNVMTSCSQMADTQFEAFADDDGDEWMANAIGVPGSQIYEDMKNEATHFRICRLRKI